MTKPKILVLDIESLPNITYAFDLFSYKKPDMIIKEKAIITFSYKWLNEKEIYVIKGNPADPYNDKELVRQILDIINEADYIVAHFGDKFDMPFIRSRALINGLPPLGPVNQIDTYKLVKKYFHLNAKRLDYLGHILGVGRKNHTSWKLWEQCAEGNKKAINEMARYNMQDVILLEKVFNKIKTHVDSRLNHALFTDNEAPVCRCCGSTKVQKRGTIVNAVTKRQRYQCQAKGCGAWFSLKLGK